MSMTPGADLVENVRAGAVMLALAYLRFLAEGDALRASVVLSAFQQFWTQNSRLILQGVSNIDGIPRDLRASGALDQPTHNALVYSFWQNSLIEWNEAVSVTQDWGAPVLRANVWPRVQTAAPTLFGAYRAAAGTSGASAGTKALQYVEDFVDGFLTQVPGSPPGDPADLPKVPSPETGGGGVDFVAPEITVPGLVPRRAQAPLWPWALAATGVGILGLGFLYKRKARR